ncbi:MAG TPA: hypothetical protein VH333_24430 [Pseudonocardiaceae bacterium]|nr:hypothetical protein [Pseudonocardiaceae bacterium]
MEPPTGGSLWNAPPGDRPARIRAAKAERARVRHEFAEARAYGLTRRHAAKLAHYRQHGLPAELADLQRRLDRRAAS